MSAKRKLLGKGFRRILDMKNRGTHGLKDLNLKEVNKVLNEIYSEINKIKSVLSEQSNKGQKTPEGAVRMKQGGEDGDFTIEFKSKNGWISNAANVYKLKGK